MSKCLGFVLKLACRKGRVVSSNGKVASVIDWSTGWRAYPGNSYNTPGKKWGEGLH